MIKEVDKNEVINILNKNFADYEFSKDPFEKVALYSHNGMIGVISYSIIYERAEINYIVVTNKRCGIGGQLLEYVLKDIEKNNCINISLEVEEDNYPAINLYLKYGFARQSIRKNYYKDKNGILMVKEMR